MFGSSSLAEQPEAGNQQVGNWFGFSFVLFKSYGCTIGLDRDYQSLLEAQNDMMTSTSG